MKKLMMMLPLACALATTSVVADQSGLELTVGADRTSWDKDRDIKDSSGWLGAIGYRINDQWGIEAMNVVTSSEDSMSQDDIDTTRYHADVLYHFNANSNVQPYFVAGYGRNWMEAVTVDTWETAFNLGAGVKSYFSDNLILRGEMRALRGSDDGQVDLAMNVALSYLIRTGNGKPAPVKAVGPSDADKDGVADTQDACPKTPIGVAVASNGCPFDTDKDGVPDYLDKCPATEANLKVDETGCAIILREAVEIKLQVLFDNNASAVKTQYYDEIGAVATFMKSYKGSVVEVQGFTDSRGSESYNRNLSQRRADAVRTVLIQQFGVDPSRVSSVGYGEANPIADNETAVGRESNRRVVASIKSQKTSNVVK